MAGKKTLHAIPEGSEHLVRLERESGGYRVRCASPEVNATVRGDARGALSVLTETGSYEARVTRDNGEIRVEVGGERFTFGLGALSAGDGAAKRSSTRADVKAPMPGKVVKLLASSGDAVTAGQGIVLFEAMKMQNEIKSPQDGVLGELAVLEGQAVEARDLLFVVNPE